MRYYIIELRRQLQGFIQLEILLFNTNGESFLLEISAEVFLFCLSRCRDHNTFFLHGSKIHNSTVTAATNNIIGLFHCLL